MPVAFSRFLAVLPLHNIHMVPVFPGRQTETPRFRLAVTTAITTSWLGVDRSGLPTTSDFLRSHGIAPCAAWNRTFTACGLEPRCTWVPSPDGLRCVHGELARHAGIEPAPPEGEETESPPACTLQQCRMFARLSGPPDRENPLLIDCHNRNYNVGLGVDRSGLPTTSDFSCSREFCTVSTENWCGMTDLNRLFPGRKGLKRPQTCANTTKPHVCPSFRAVISTLLNFICGA